MYSSPSYWKGQFLDRSFREFLKLAGSGQHNCSRPRPVPKHAAPAHCLLENITVSVEHAKGELKHAWASAESEHVDLGDRGPTKT